jgi:hypothetical protein
MGRSTKLKLTAGATWSSLSEGVDISHAEHENVVAPFGCRKRNRERKLIYSELAAMTLFIKRNFRIPQTYLRIQIKNSNGSKLHTIFRLSLPPLQLQSGSSPALVRLQSGPNPAPIRPHFTPTPAPHQTYGDF